MQINRQRIGFAAQNFVPGRQTTSLSAYVQIDDMSFLLVNGISGLQPWVVQLPEYAGMSKSDNSKAIGAGLTFRTLVVMVQNTAAWWYSDAVPQERRDNILTNERALSTLEEEIIEKWKNR